MGSRHNTGAAAAGETANCHGVMNGQLWARIYRRYDLYPIDTHNKLLSGVCSRAISRITVSLLLKSRLATTRHEHKIVLIIASSVKKTKKQKTIQYSEQNTTLP